MKIRLSSLRAELRRQLYETRRAKAERTVVNGYTLPGGQRGLAVRAAVDLLLSHPGIPRKDFLDEMRKTSTAHPSFLVSPTAPNSPLGKLWRRERKKSDVMRYYLLPGAEVLANTFHEAQMKMQAELTRISQEKMRKTLLHLKKMNLSVGDYITFDPEMWPHAVWRGFWRIQAPSPQDLDYVIAEKIDPNEMQVVGSATVPIHDLTKLDAQLDWRPNETLPEDFYSF